MNKNRKIAIIGGALFIMAIVTLFIGQAFYKLPIALQELTMSIWLIVKGFNPTAITADFTNAVNNKIK